MQEIDALLRQAYPPNEPGAAVIVVKDGATVLRAGYGMANVELGVAIEPDMVFRLGSITKQFTAVLILMLVEEGKLRLDDDIRRYLPDYPTHGYQIAVEHLLTHTSGVKDHLDMPEWQRLERMDVRLGELIDVFKNEPLDFAPGTGWAYSNSGYVLLGAIIERAAGEAYEDVLRRRIFDPLCMTRSAYDHTERIVPGRVAGYELGAAGFQNARYLSLTHPHAAGAIMSSVDDLAKWDAALSTEQLLRQETLRRAWTSATLRDGTATGYGFGWLLADYAGRRTIEHPGGIHGFLTYAVRVPDERLYVAILTNRMAPEPSLPFVTLSVAGLACGLSVREPATILLEDAALDAMAGVYHMRGHDCTIGKEDGRLVLGSGGYCTALLPVTPTEFLLRSDPFMHVRFSLGADGVAASLEIKGRYALRIERGVRAETG